MGVVVTVLIFVVLFGAIFLFARPSGPRRWSSPSWDASPRRAVDPVDDGDDDGDDGDGGDA
jgi:hypothetical protein